MDNFFPVEYTDRTDAAHGEKNSIGWGAGEERKMLEYAVLLAFIGALAACVASGASTLWALAAGYVLFFAYGLKRGFGAKEVWNMSLSGIRTVKNILIIFVLIGVLTAWWRAAGTIPAIVCFASSLIRPSAFVLITFLLNGMLSVLTGTSFGTAATMGVICMAMGNTLGANPVYVGGAILAGAFFGDRCSPVSTSANLVCQLTGTDIFSNLRRMIRTSVVPFLLTCVIYYFLGRSDSVGSEVLDVWGLFSGSFCLDWPAVLPAAVILILCVFKVKVRMTMLVSIALAAACGLLLQNMTAAELARTAVFGYHAADPALAPLLDGGGLLSMVRVTVIVSLSSSYSGLFAGTGLLEPITARIQALSRRITSYGSTLVVSILTSLIACNQTLATMLTYQLCRETEPDSQVFAIDLENTVIVLAALVPWSIAGAVPLASVGAPASSMAAACYLYLLPLWNLLVRLRGGRRSGQ